MEKWREKPRILIVDDDDEFISDLKILLSSEFEVDGVTDTRRASDMLAHYRPDCLLLDLNMPMHYGKNNNDEGISFLRHIRNKAMLGSLGKVPVIVLTGRKKVDHLAGSKEFDIATLYHKPPDIKRLMTTIWSLVSEVGRS